MIKIKKLPLNELHIPGIFKGKRFTPEDEEIIRNLAVNQICELCNKSIYTCFCNVELGEIN
jgi:hypothetical protein